MEIITEPSIVARLYKDTETGITIVEDTLGRFHLLTQELLTEEEQGEQVYLSTIADTTWPGITDFYLIMGMNYIVPSGKSFIIDFITAASNKEAGNILAIYVNEVLQNMLPFGIDLNFDFKASPNYPAFTEIDLRFKPPVRNTKLTVCMGGRVK